MWDWKINLMREVMQTPHFKAAAMEAVEDCKNSGGELTAITVSYDEIMCEDFVSPTGVYASNGNCSSYSGFACYEVAFVEEMGNEA